MAQADFHGNTGYYYPFISSQQTVSYAGGYLHSVTVTHHNGLNNDICTVVSKQQTGQNDCSEYDCSVVIQTGTQNHIRTGAQKTGTFAIWRDGLVVSTLDLVVIQQHISHNQGETQHPPFFSMAQYIAADVDDDFDILNADIEILRKVILGSALPIMPAWNFSNSIYLQQSQFETYMKMYKPTNQDYENFKVLFGSAFNRIVNNGTVLVPSSRQFTVNGDILYCTSEWGIKMGDVNYTESHSHACTETVFLECPENGIDDMDPGFFDTRSSRELRDVFVSVNNIGNDAIILTVTMNDLDLVCGLQNAINLRIPVKTIMLRNSHLPGFSENHFYYNKEDQILRVSWHDEYLNPEARNWNGNTVAELELHFGSALSSTELTDLFDYDYKYNFSIDYSLELENIRFLNKSLESSISVFPNPSRDHVVFDLDGITSPVRVLLYDVQGVLIATALSEGSRRLFVDLPQNLGSGLILYRVETDSNVFTGKIVVQR